METNKEIEEIFSLLSDGKLRPAIDRLESFGYKYHELRVAARLEPIRSNYDLMAGYWQRGFKDASLPSVYNGLITTVYRLAADVGLAYSINHNSFLSALFRKSRANGRDDSFLSTAIGELEGFVSDLALLDLEPENERSARRKALYLKHQNFVSDLFDYILTSSQWSEGTVETLSRLLLSPTVDAMDQQLIVAAVMLGAINVFDMNKLRLLVTVYQQSADENVRQRALVGIVFAVWKGNANIFPEQRKIIADMVADERTQSELTELQIQLLYCINAEVDTRTIQKEIMPDIIKHNNLHITAKGIEEVEEDPMQDILDSEASERNMEKLEQSFRRMIDMQKAGADIYFGGFSQMKRFSFFDTVSNWFTPYYPDHPAISQLYSNNKANSDIVNAMIGHVAFCNSDKYSFVIAFQKVVDRLPANLREMLANGSATMVGQRVEPGTQSPAYVRRMYLQDLYRFFRLFHSRSCFNNPFEVYSDGNAAPGYVFFANTLFRGTALEGKFNEIVACMAKRKLYADAADVAANYSDETKDYQYFMLCGNLLLRHSDIAVVHGLSGLTASDCFDRALALKPADVKALFGKARALFYEGRYGDSAAAYSQLMLSDPENRKYTIGYCVCQTNLGNYDECQPMLFKMNYESPDDDTVKRILARCLVGGGKYEQALKLYDGMKMDSEDLANRAYCEWFMGDVQTAVSHFADYISSRYPNDDTESKRRRCYSDVIESERDFIRAHGISETETFLMVDAIRDAIVR